MVLLRTFLENEAAQSSDSTTYTRDLPENGVLSALMLKIRHTNGSTSNKDAAISDVITRVELLGNGSFVIFSLTGEELDRFSWMFVKRRPPEFQSEDANDVQFATFMIPFGRHIGDKKFGLDLAQFKNVQLRIQYNAAAINAVGATGFVTGTFNVTVVAYRYPAIDGIRPVGFRRIREFVVPTDAASGTRRYEIPLQHKLIAVHTFVREDAIADDVDVTALQLEANNGELRIYDTNWDDLQNENASEMSVDPWHHQTIFKSDTDTVDFKTGICRSVSIQTEHVFEATADTEIFMGLESRSGDRLTLAYHNIVTVAGSELQSANTTDDTQLVSVAGDGVGNWASMILSRQPDWEDALDTTKFAKLELVITSGASGATLGAVTEEIVTVVPAS